MPKLEVRLQRAADEFVHQLSILALGTKEPGRDGVRARAVETNCVPLAERDQHFREFRCEAFIHCGSLDAAIQFFRSV